MSSYTAAQVAEHTSRDDLWVVIEGNVYKVPSDFLNEHPGGGEIIEEVAGKDVTEEFEDTNHSDEARDQLKEMLIGKLATAEVVAPAPAEVTAKVTGIVSNEQAVGAVPASPAAVETSSAPVGKAEKSSDMSIAVIAFIGVSLAALIGFKLLA